MSWGAGPAVQTGADLLVGDDFALLAGRRVGLITNHTAMVGEDHLADLLHAAANVELAALFGPEHGIRGDADAGAGVTDTVDARIGVPVYSLYGERRSPEPAILEALEVLIFDVQDVGARFYTYISTMGLSMEAAAAAGIEFVILDRPNPIGGDYVSGFVREEEFKSFVGFYPIPVAHGMTVAELARMAAGEGWLAGAGNLHLTVVPMKGWKRSMQWVDTGLSWIPTSPNIPDFETALVYPGACLVEGTVASEGRGTLQPFLTIGAEWLDGNMLAASLNSIGIDGLRFAGIEFTPRSIPGMAGSPKLIDVPLSGIRYEVAGREAVRPVEAGVHLLRGMLDQYSQDSEAAEFFRAQGFDRLAGTRRLRELLLSGSSAQAIIDSWHEEVAAFSERRAGYLLYD